MLRLTEAIRERLVLAQDCSVLRARRPLDGRTPPGTGTLCAHVRRDLGQLDADAPGLTRFVEAQLTACDEFERQLVAAWAAPGADPLDPAPEGLLDLLTDRSGHALVDAYRRFAETDQCFCSDRGQALVDALRRPVFVEPEAADLWRDAVDRAVRPLLTCRCPT